MPLQNTRSFFTLALSVAVAHSVVGQNNPLPINTKGLTATRTLRIDGNTADLSDVHGFDVIGSGTIVVTQPQDGLFRFFDADGKTLGTFGRKGSGPGEFRQFGRQGHVGDTLWMIEGNRRVTYFSIDRKLVRVGMWPMVLKRSAHDTAGFTGGVGLPIQATYGDGTILLHVFKFAEKYEVPSWLGPGGEGKGYALATADGIFKKMVAWFNPAQDNCYPAANASSGTSNTRVPFCAPALSDLSADGSHIYLLEQSNANGASATYQLRILNAKGDTIFAHRYMYKPLSITRKISDSALEVAASIRGITADRAHAIRAMPVPSTYPPVRMILVGRDGTVWHELWRTEPGHHWLVTDPNGIPLGNVVLPPNVSLRVTERNTVWGVETGDDGLQSIVRYHVGP